MENLIYSAGELNQYERPPYGSDNLNLSYLYQVNFGEEYLQSDSYKKLQNDPALKKLYYKKVKLLYIARNSFLFGATSPIFRDFSYTDEENLKIKTSLEQF